ncbi:hypothetical protein ACOBV8_19190 (plasmid) [Pseudoalteromonas espejiana]
MTRRYQQTYQGLPA